MNLRRILMNAADGSPGGGQPAAPAQPTAAPAPAAAAPVSPEAVQAIAASVRDGVFAELRRSGVLKEQKAKPAPKAEGEGGESTATANAATSIDPLKMRALDRTVARMGMAEKLSAAAYSRLERDFVADNPADPDAWLRDYFSGFGVQSTTGNATTPAVPPAAGNTTTAPHPTANGQPVTAQGGPPAPPKAPVESLDLWTCSQADRDAFIKAKGLKAYNQLLMAQGKGRKVSLK